MQPRGCDLAKIVPMRPLPPILFLMILGLMGLMHYLLGGALWLSPPWTLIGIGPVVLGFGLGFWGIFRFRSHHTKPRPGKGNATALVTDGPYRFTRNPMYLGMTLVLLGAGLLIGSISALLGPLLFIPLITQMWIVREECWMAEAFGENYAEYRNRVRRWL
jgi:protein-S-isoprenylcysteine O-methyltransferase Ste14